MLKIIVPFDSRIENFRCNMNTMFHATSIVKDVELIIAILMFNYCNICRSGSPPHPPGIVSFEGDPGGIPHLLTSSPPRRRWSRAPEAR